MLKAILFLIPELSLIKAVAIEGVRLDLYAFELSTDWLKEMNISKRFIIS